MKKYIGMLCIVLVASVALIGCGGSASSRVESSFASAEPSLKDSAQKAVDAVKAGNYAAAGAQLQALAGNAKLTPDQQQAVKDLIADMQKQIQAQAAKAAEGAQKALGDLQKKFGK